MLAIIMAAVAIIAVTVTIVVAPLVMTVVIAALVAIRMGNPFSFLSIGVAIC
jgi:hypothetical protein